MATSPSDSGASRPAPAPTEPAMMAAIRAWQANPRVHPLTCGNKSSHRPLVAHVGADEILMLACLDCPYTQSIDQNLANILLRGASLSPETPAPMKLLYEGLEKSGAKLVFGAEPARETQAPPDDDVLDSWLERRFDCIASKEPYFAKQSRREITKRMRTYLAAARELNERESAVEPSGTTARTPEPCGDMMHNGTYDAALEAVMNEDGPPDETMAIYNDAQLSRLAVQWLVEDDAWTHMPAFGTGLIRELARRLNAANAKPEEF